MASNDFSKELHLAEIAVQKAVLVTKKVLQLVAKGEHTKKDNTSVSLADFAAQALLVAAIHSNFPDDTIISEEDTALLREKPGLAAKVWNLVDATRLDDADSEAFLHSPKSQEETLQSINRGGQGFGGSKGRVWFIDPADGTKGFLNQGRYVVCVILMVDGEEKMAAFGCPHLDVEAGKLSESDVHLDGPGYLISAIRGQGARIRPLGKGILEPSWLLPRLDEQPNTASLRFCENTKTTTPQFADVGFSDIVLPTPLPGDPPAHIWDHAGGIMLFEEVGGKVTDLNGKPLLLTTGRDLTENFGFIAAPASIHARVVEAAKKVFADYPEYSQIITQV
ncbi:hypothetical protein B9Z65_4878 [Elsinoe australis]|uniref:3'(2'),5'-bisphosphate nucleotidase n=1 Tax=Elsinoe australis TaxID=40998 RepID=A0A2P8A6A0_9PEZI|nr:hypothetical protein B9Z65_4878 [Elsinoe australis]